MSVWSNVLAQTHRDVPPREEADLGPQFFEQLRHIFGEFRHADLQQVFQDAQPLTCSQLAGAGGEWREVGFFNENRGLGGWFRTSMAEIRSQLDVYEFSGNCDGTHSSVRVATQFPVKQSLTAYREGRIHFGEIEVKPNPPVNAGYDRQTQAYAFDLPYLYRVSDAKSYPLYALSPIRRSDDYASDVINRWECKAVTARDVTYQFLICRTSLLLRDAASSAAAAKSSYGLSAFSILSDGKEAAASVNLSFDDLGDTRH